MKLILWRHNQQKNANELKRLALRHYDLTIVLKGSLHYRINGTKVSVSDNEIIFINPNDIRERQGTKQPVNYISFNFTTEEPLNLPLKLPESVNHEIKLLISCIDAITEEYHTNAKEQILHLLQCIILNIQSRLENGNAPILVIKIKQYINSHLSQKITLDKIGTELFFNPIYCATIFKQHTGLPIITYVIQRRIKESKRLISEGISLNAIPELIGFESYSYFARTFKKHTNLSPLEYKNSIMK